jgi:uncharacterized membrane protein
MKAIKIIFLMFLLSFSFSHTFVPYDFTLTCPKDFTATVGKEVSISITIKNTGMNDDYYNITVNSPMNIRVIPQSLTTNRVKSGESISISFSLLPLSFLGGDEISIFVQSANLPSKSSVCSFRVRVNYFSLGNFDTYYFLIVFIAAILLIFL